MSNPEYFVSYLIVLVNPERLEFLGAILSQLGRAVRPRVKLCLILLTCILIPPMPFC